MLLMAESRRALLTVVPTSASTPHSAGSSVECCAEREETSQSDTIWQQASRQARWLSWVSLIWMTAEGAIGLFAGIRDASIALVGWALGSVIEGLASVIVIWRFTGSRAASGVSERQAQRAVAVSFFLLAPYVTVVAIRDLVAGHAASPGALGMVVTAVSVVLMPALWIAKQRLAKTLNSGATAGEAIQNLMCAAQAAAVLLGLAATAAFGWTWLDPSIALLLAAWAIREGVSAWQGKACC